MGYTKGFEQLPSPAQVGPKRPIHVRGKCSIIFNLWRNFSYLLLWRTFAAIDAELLGRTVVTPNLKQVYVRLVLLNLQSTCTDSQTLTTFSRSSYALPATWSSIGTRSVCDIANSSSVELGAVSKTEII